MPWCVRKCPYCDFNSHAVPDGQLSMDLEQQYLTALVADFETQVEMAQGRLIHSVFIGGGTPSLISAQGYQWLFDQLKARLSFSDDCEITLEANPGTVEHDPFADYLSVGINRLSIGVQSFDTEHLQRLGRIHSAHNAMDAIQQARQAGFERVNVDLMHGLPSQTVEQALTDLKLAVEHGATHISWYQLTIEPNTMFYYRQPILPDDDELWDIFEQGHQLLTEAGYEQYETSAYAKKGYQCQHNLNYWRFGDYLAIGCGAHGKISYPTGEIYRFSKTKHPKGYMRGEYRYSQEQIAPEDRPFEFFMNRFRLLEAVPKAEFEQYTGLSAELVKPKMDWALSQNYITETATHWQITQHGKLFLNELLEKFLD